MNTRYLAIDYGTKRIGLAISDPAGDFASPLKTLEIGGSFDQQIDAVLRAAGDFNIDQWIVGLPLNMDGTKGPAAHRCEKFAKALAKRTDAPVHLWDERLSSHAADGHLSNTGLTHKQKRRRRDAIAAQTILADFLEAQRNAQHP